MADVFREHASGVSGERDGATGRAAAACCGPVRCRTAALGGHVEACDRCGHQRIAYNSCRNRHCPKCQGAGSRRAGWRPARPTCLPVAYFHVVFTLPQRLGPLALQNPARRLRPAVPGGRGDAAGGRRRPEHLGAEIGFLAVLHTWGQNLLHHPHVHCVVPAAGCRPTVTRWIACRPGFFLPVRVLSRVFRGKFLHALEAGLRARRTGVPRRSWLSWPQADPFERLLDQAVRHDWVVYAKPPFGGPDTVLKYLARYTHRVAICNHRLVALRDGRVTFRWKDYAAGRAASKTMTLAADEFIRRFLLHVLPGGFVQIRHYGFLANRCRAASGCSVAVY